MDPDGCKGEEEVVRRAPSPPPLKATGKGTKRGLRNKKKKKTHVPTTTENHPGLRQSVPSEKFHPTTTAGWTAPSSPATGKGTKRGLRNKKKKKTHVPTTTDNHPGLRQSFPSEKFHPTTTAGWTAPSSPGAVASSNDISTTRKKRPGLRQAYLSDEFHPTPAAGGTATRTTTTLSAPAAVASAPILFEDGYLEGADYGIANSSADSKYSDEEYGGQNPQEREEEEQEQGDRVGNEGAPLLEATLVNTDSIMNVSASAPVQEVYMAQPTPADEKGSGFVLQRWLPNSSASVICCLGFWFIAAGVIVTGIVCGSGMCSDSGTTATVRTPEHTASDGGTTTASTPWPKTSPPTLAPSIMQSTSMPSLQPTNYTPSLPTTSSTTNTASNIFLHNISSNATPVPSIINGSNTSASVAGDNAAGAATGQSTSLPTFHPTPLPTADPTTNANTGLKDWAGSYYGGLFWGGSGGTWGGVAGSMEFEITCDEELNVIRVVDDLGVTPTSYSYNGGGDLTWTMPQGDVSITFAETYTSEYYFKDLAVYPGNTCSGSCFGGSFNPTNTGKLAFRGSGSRFQWCTTIELFERSYSRSTTTSIDLNNNQLAGLVPTELGLMYALTELSLHTNQLTGPIPTELGLMTELTYLYLSVNFLTGPIPTELGLMTALTKLSLMNNQLSGPIPTELGLMTALADLGLWNNQLTGTVPASLCALTGLHMRPGPGVFCPADCGKRCDARNT